MCHCITIKPVIAGGVAALFYSKCKFVASVAGMGTIFTTTSIKNKVLKLILKYIFRVIFIRAESKAIFQNDCDLSFFVNNKILKKNQTILIPGSGVDLNFYNSSPQPKSNMKRVLLPARLIREKGVFEYLHAANDILKSRNDVVFCLAGELDPGNPTSLSESDILRWGKINGIIFLGHVSSMKELLSVTDIVVLPSYREGFPKSLIEAAAIGRPVITTNVPGCRDAVIDGKTGLLVKSHDVNELKLAILKLLDNYPMRCNMGLLNREVAQRDYCVEAVVRKHIQIYNLNKDVN